MSVDNNPLPAIPAKRYFTIGEVSELCGVKAYVLRYWEQEFTQLKPMKRRGNRRYYQHHEVLLIRRIRDLLYEQGFTISGARNQLADTPPSPAPAGGAERAAEADGEAPADARAAAPVPGPTHRAQTPSTLAAADRGLETAALDDAALEAMAREDLAIIERAQRARGDFSAAGLPPRATASLPSGGAGIRAAALETRRSSPTAASTPPSAGGSPSTPDELRAELLAIRALLVG